MPRLLTPHPPPKTTYQTVLGQQLDLITAEDGVVDFSKFSIAKHSNIVKYKTAFYSFYLPVAAAMRMVRCRKRRLWTWTLSQTLSHQLAPAPNETPCVTCVSGAAIVVDPLVFDTL